MNAMQWGTWLSVLILGPGSAAVFVWFLLDMRKLLRERGNRASECTAATPPEHDNRQF